MEYLPPDSSGGVTEIEKTVSVEQIKEEIVVILDDDPEIGGSGDGGGGDFSQHSTIPVPKPMEGLRESGPPPFLKKIYEMVEDPETLRTISWNLSGKSFIIYDQHSFSCNFLPKYFKHSNFSSFVRQLNTYGFKKIDPDRFEFAHRGFQKGKKGLLKTIKRRKHSSSQTAHPQGSEKHCLDQTILETEAEIVALRRDGKELRRDIKKLKEEQESADFHLAAAREQIVNAETKQQQFLVFVSKAFTCPAFLDRFVQFLRQKEELCDGHIAKKPRLVAEDKGKSSVGDAQNQEELATINAEVDTLFSDSLDDDGGDNINMKDDATPGLDIQDFCSENYILWEKLLTDDMIIGHEAQAEENKVQDPSMIVEELKSLIGNDPMVEQVG